MTAALEGVNVLDLTRLLPGPFCTMMLADMGADVIKVQELEPRFLPFEGDEETRAAYNQVDRNKRSIALNLKTDEGRAIFHKLAETADVLVEEFRPGVTKRLGIDYDTLKEINPRLIYCAITGYGQDGPYAQLAGHDPNYLGVGGILGMTGAADGTHVLPACPIADLAGGGMQAAIGVLLSLLARERTGRGQFVDISMTDEIVLWTAARHWANYFVNGAYFGRGERPPMVFQARDEKYLSITAAEPYFWERLCRAMGLEELIPRHHDIRPTPSKDLDPQKKEEVLSRLAEVFRTRDREEWLDILARADTCVAPVHEFEEVFTDPQLLHRQMILEQEHPTLGKVKQVGISIKLSETPGAIHRFAPQRGEHTEEILESLGYVKESIEGLRQKGVVK